MVAATTPWTKTKREKLTKKIGSTENPTNLMEINIWQNLVFTLMKVPMEPAKMPKLQKVALVK
jgi:hypothetical protein